MLVKMRDTRVKNEVDVDGEGDDFLSRLDGDPDDPVFEVD